MIFPQLLSYVIAASLSCDSTHNPPVHPAFTKNGGCEDDDVGLRRLQAWSNYNCADDSITYCESSTPSFKATVRKYCPYTCGLCSRDNDAGLKKLWGGSYSCSYSKSYGYCTSQDKMKQYCPQTCGFVAKLLKENESCWNHCHNRSGPCTWCGSGKCCRKGYTLGDGVCLPGEGGDSQHICIADATLCRVRYGDEIIIQSQRNSYGNRKMLEQRSVVPKLTTQQARVVNKASVWKIWNTTKIGEGCVSYGDEIVLENQYELSFPNYQMLQRNEVPSFTVEFARVTNKAAVWKIQKKTGDGQGCVSYGDDIVIRNQYSPSHHMLAAGSDSVRFTDNSADIQNNAAVWQVLDIAQRMPSCAVKTEFPCTTTHQGNGNQVMAYYGMPPHIPGQQEPESNLQQVYVRMPKSVTTDYCTVGLRFATHTDLYIWGLPLDYLPNAEVQDENVWRTVKMFGRSPVTGHTFTESSEAAMKFWNPMGAERSNLCEIVFTVPRSFGQERGMLFDYMADSHTNRHHGRGGSAGRRFEDIFNEENVFTLTMTTSNGTAST
eukprot:GEMP01005069.1.p1 GENE.GEMP01005069.1~~GEMP01005069.1.p1  ORF type:complete len:547 (-),score=58.01 GEMP01005069.1:2409-4049(-)